MIDILLNILMIWAIVGFSSAFIDLFIFFRGMTHMIQCHVAHKDPRIKKMGQNLSEFYNENLIALYITFFGIYTLLGPFTTFVLISDFFRFSFTENKS